MLGQLKKTGTSASLITASRFVVTSIFGFFMFFFRVGTECTVGMKLLQGGGLFDG